ncbi:MAG: corrinoid protein [Candidatus Bathyarchaeia archaeon]
MITDIKEELFKSVVELNMEKTIDLCKVALEHGIEAKGILEVLLKGLDEIGKRYERSEYFIPELIAAGELMKEALEILKPHLASKEPGAKRVKMVIGTVEGDIHDIGKNLVITLLLPLGLEIIDLGVDVPAEKFIEAVKIHKPKILGLSALLTTTMPQMKKVIETLKKENLRDTVKVIVGGRPVTPEFAREIGADAYGEDGFSAREIISKWIMEDL